MIQNEKTFEKFGYYAKDLTQGSNKQVVITCDYCGIELLKVNKLIKGQNAIVNKDCCAKCKHKKAEEVNIAKYGVANQFQRPEVIKSNVENANYAARIEKAKTTNLEKYGVVSSLQSSTIKEKIKNTMIERYGVENCLQNPEVRRKAEITMKKRYGVEHAAHCPELIEKVKSTNIKKYGVDNVFKSKEIKDKIIKTNISKYGCSHRLKVKKLALENAQKSLKTKIQNGYIKIYDGKTKSQLAQEIGFSKSRFCSLCNMYGVDQALTMSPRQSSLETVFENWLKEENIEYNKNYVDGRRPDFVINNIVIELNGNWFHSDGIQEDKNYHKEKREHYIDNGFRPYFFREDEIVHKFPIVKSIIKNAMGQSNKVYARKCVTQECDKTISNNFIKTNHLMGPAHSSICMFLYLDSIPITCLQMKRYSKNNWEISRFCNILNTTVIGGFTKLLDFFILHHKPDSIFTFIDLRYGSGEYLNNFGFNKASENLSFKWTNGNVVHNRMKFPGNSGYEQGFNKLWDCGQAKYIKYF